MKERIDSMKILIISQYFYPEEFKINDLAKELVLRGHRVTVLTGKPNYPKGEYYEGYSFKGITREDYWGADIIRVPLRKRGRGKAINLVRNYFSFVFNANRYIHKNKMTFDAIFCFAISPITQAFPALYCKKKYGGKVLIWIQDLWPESITAAGGIKNKLVLGMLNQMVRRIYERSDLLLIQSEAFIESILKKGDFKAKLRYVPNWAEDLYLNKHLVNETTISNMLPPGFRVMFAGNVGAAQDAESIIKAALETRDIPDIKWIIVGDGRCRETIEKMTKDLELTKTVWFLGRHPMNEMPTFFSFADAMIVSLKDEYIFSLTVPAKTQSYMASGKPVLSMLNGEGNRIIEQAHCGLTAGSGDYKTLAQNVVRLYRMTREEREKLGNSGLAYYRSHFDKTKVIDSIVKLMEA